MALKKVKLVNVRYIGDRTPMFDRVSGSGVMWANKGDCQLVTEDEAAKLLKHPGIWRKDKNQPKGEDAYREIDTEAVMREISARSHPLVDLHRMEGSDLRGYAMREFGHIFDAKDSDEHMRHSISSMIQQV